MNSKAVPVLALACAATVAAHEGTEVPAFCGGDHAMPHPYDMRRDADDWCKLTHHEPEKAHAQMNRAVRTNRRFNNPNRYYFDPMQGTPEGAYIQLRQRWMAEEGGWQVHQDPLDSDAHRMRVMHPETQRELRIKLYRAVTPSRKSDAAGDVYLAYDYRYLALTVHEGVEQTEVLACHYGNASRRVVVLLLDIGSVVSIVEAWLGQEDFYGRACPYEHILSSS